MTRDELVARYKGLAHSIARRRCHRKSEQEDVDQVAMMALVKAADRFDVERNVSFTTFAWSTIEGEVKRYFRDHSSPIHVTRSLRECGLRVSAVADDLTNSLGRTPTMAEIAESAGLSVERVIEAYELMRSLRPLSIDSAGPDDETIEIAAMDNAEEASDDRNVLLQLTSHLPQRERTILALRFFEQRSQAEIGEMLGLSQMHVSRLLNKSLVTLRELSRPHR
jgi:RNA polymerase sigma-B factor